MEFKLLGAMELVEDGSQVPIAGRKLRLLLAMLLVKRNDHVEASWLADQLWIGEAPEKARNKLHALVLRLRQLLEPGRQPRGAGVLVSEPGGYVLRISRESVDADRFDDHLASARRLHAAGKIADAFTAVRRALDEWSDPGNALADLASEAFAQEEVARLNWSYAAATELWIESGLSLGRQVEVVRAFEGLVRTPLPAQLLEWLVRRLYDSGRLQDALAVCQAQQRTYVAKCDADLPPAIQELRERIARYELPAMPSPEPSLAVDDGDDGGGYRRAEAQALINLGIVYFRQEAFDAAIESYSRALAIYEGLGARYGQAQTLDNLAGAYWEKGDVNLAERHWRAAFDLFRQVGAPEVDRIWGELNRVGSGGRQRAGNG
jgi:DNA-binding SARP family transcriptional activator